MNDQNRTARLPDHKNELFGENRDTTKLKVKSYNINEQENCTCF